MGSVLKKVFSERQDWVTIYEKRYCSYEQYDLVPILLGPKQILNSMEDLGWSREYKNSEPKLIIPNRGDFLCKAFYKKLSNSDSIHDLQVQMNGANPIYKDKKNGEILKIVYDRKGKAISIRKDILCDF